MASIPEIRLFADAHVFDQEYQGSRTFIKEIYTLLSHKQNIRLFLGAYDTDNLRSVFPPCGNIEFIKYKTRSAFSRLLNDIPAIIAKYKIDYAHFQYIVPAVKKCRYIVTIHDVIFKDYPEQFTLPYRVSKKFLYGRSASSADIITTVSEFSKRSIESHLNIASDKIHIVPNGIPHKFFIPYDKQKSKSFITYKYGFNKFILYVSRFEPRKNHLALLKAFLNTELYKKGITLVLIGHRTLAIPGFDQMLNKLPPEIRKHIFLSSEINDEELLEFYRAADLFVYPSLAEGFGIPPLEAAAMKIPVICSNTSALADFDFFGRYHIDASNTALLGSTLEETIANPPSAEELERISFLVKKKYSRENAANVFYELLMQHDAAFPIKQKNKNDQPAIS